MSSPDQLALPSIVPREVGGSAVRTVLARDLHAFLDVGRDFATWIKERIEKYGFVEGQDFVVFTESGENPQGGRPTKGYALTLDMGKELAMVENNDAGRRCRRHFIEAERRLLNAGRPMPVSPRNTFEDYLAIARLCGFEGNMARLAANQATMVVTGIDPLRTMGVTHLIADHQEELLTATAIGGRTGDRSAKEVNLQLCRLGLQEKESGTKKSVWVPTDKGEPYGQWMDTSKKHGGGTPVRQWKWLASVLPMVRADLASSTGAH